MQQPAKKKIETRGGNRAVQVASGSEGSSWVVGCSVGKEIKD